MALYKTSDLNPTDSMGTADVTFPDDANAHTSSRFEICTTKSTDPATDTQFLNIERSSAFITEIKDPVDSIFTPKAVVSGDQNLLLSSVDDDPLVFKIYKDDDNFNCVRFPPKYICRICLEPLRKPVRFSYCSHVFCADCTHYLFELWRKTCPICNDQSIIYDQETMFPGLRYIRYNPFLTLIDEKLENEIQLFMGFTPYAPSPGDIVRILAPRELYQLKLIRTYCGVVQDVTDGIISEDLTHILDKEAVDGMAINERYKINALHTCKVIRVNCYGTLWIGRLCEVEPLRVSTYVLGTRVTYGSLVIETAKLPEKITCNMSSIFAVKDIAVQERELFVENSSLDRSTSSSLTSLTREAREYLEEDRRQNIMHSSVVREFAIFARRQRKWNITVPYYPNWPKFVPLSLIVKTNLYNNMDVFYRYKMKVKQTKHSHSVSRTLQNIMSLTASPGRGQYSPHTPDFDVAPLVMSSTPVIPIKAYLVKHDLISVHNPPILGFSAVSCALPSDVKLERQENKAGAQVPISSKVDVKNVSKDISTKTNLQQQQQSLLTAQQNYKDVDIDSGLENDELTDIETFKQQVLPPDLTTDTESNRKSTGDGGRYSSHTRHRKTKPSISSISAGIRPSEILKVSQTGVNTEAPQKSLNTIRRAKVQRWPEALAEQNILIEAATRRNAFDDNMSEQNSSVATVYKDVIDEEDILYDKTYSFSYETNVPTLLSTNLTYCHPSHLRKFLRVITDFTTWYTHKEFCCSGCRGLLRFPVKALCGHYYCYNCYMDCRENSWVCFDCGSIMEHARSSDRSSDAGTTGHVHHKLTYIYGTQMPQIDWGKVCAMRKQLPWFNCLVDYGFPCIVRGFSRAKIGILMDDPSTVYCHILFGKKHIEVHNISTISSINVFDLRPALRYGDGLTLTQSRHSSQFNFGLCNISPAYLYTDSTIFCATRYSSELFVMGLNMNVLVHKTLRLVEDLEPKLAVARKKGRKKQIDEEQKDFLDVWNWCQYVRDTDKQQFEMLIYGDTHNEAKGLTQPSFLTQRHEPLSSPSPPKEITTFTRKRHQEDMCNISPAASSKKTDNEPLSIAGRQPVCSPGAHRRRVQDRHRNYNPQTSVTIFQYHHQLRPKRAPTTTAYHSKHPFVDPSYRNKLTLKDQEIIKQRKEFIHWYFNQIEMHPDNSPINSAELNRLKAMGSCTQQYSLKVENRLEKYDSTPRLDTPLEKLLKAEERNQYIVRSLCELSYRFPALEFLCTSCHCVLRRPVRLICQHIVCRTCACIHLASEIPCLACGTPILDISRVHYEVELENYIIYAVDHMFYSPKYDVGVIVRSTTSSNTGMIVGMTYLQGIHYAYVAFFGVVKLCRCSDLLILEPDWKKLDLSQILTVHSSLSMSIGIRQSSFHHQMGSFLRDMSILSQRTEWKTKLAAIRQKNRISHSQLQLPSQSNLTLSVIESADDQKQLYGSKNAIFGNTENSGALAFFSGIQSVSTTASGVTSSDKSKSASTPFSYTNQQLSGISSSLTDNTMFLSLAAVSEPRNDVEKSVILAMNESPQGQANSVAPQQQLNGSRSAEELNSALTGRQRLEIGQGGVQSDYESGRSHQRRDERLLTSPRESLPQDDALTLQSNNQPGSSTQSFSGDKQGGIVAADQQSYRLFERSSLRRIASAPDMLERSSHVPEEVEMLPTESFDFAQVSVLPNTRTKGQQGSQSTTQLNKRSSSTGSLSSHSTKPTRSNLVRRPLPEIETDEDIGLPFIDGTRVTKLRPYFYDGKELLKTMSGKGALDAFNFSSASNRSSQVGDQETQVNDPGPAVRYPQLGDVFVVINGPYKGLLGLTQSYAKAYSTLLLSYYCLLETGTAHEFYVTDLHKITLLPAMSVSAIRKQLTTAKSQNENMKKMHWYNIIMENKITTAAQFDQKKRLFNLQCPNAITAILRAKEKSAEGAMTTVATISGVEAVTVSPSTNLNTLLEKKIILRSKSSRKNHPWAKSSGVDRSGLIATPERRISIQSPRSYGQLDHAANELISPLCRSFSVKTLSRTSLIHEGSSGQAKVSPQDQTLNPNSSFQKIATDS